MTVTTSEATLKEEVDIISGSTMDLRLDETSGAAAFARRPPGMEHGPWISKEGCTTFEVRYEATAALAQDDRREHRRES